MIGHVPPTSPRNAILGEATSMVPLISNFKSSISWTHVMSSLPPRGLEATMKLQVLEALPFGYVRLMELGATSMDMAVSDGQALNQPTEPSRLFH
jgi:hypothetical protein